MAELMVDIETGGVSPDAAVFTIGACSFERYRDVIHDSFEVKVSMADNSKEGRRLDGSTMEWWISQSKEAQQGLIEGEITNLRQALKRFRMWVEQANPPMHYAWANDPDFDVVILKNAFDSVGEWWPFKFFLNRSCRTIFELAYPDIDEQKNMRDYYRGEGVHHRAEDDAIAQAKMVQHCFRKLGLA